MVTFLEVVQLAVFPLLLFVWNREGRPRPFRRWLSAVCFGEETVRAMERPCDRCWPPSSPVDRSG